MNNVRQRIVAFVAGLLLGPAMVWAGLESGTYISDLVATNPLSSDLASTGDDHIRLLKSTIKNSFPNINGAVSATDEELSLLAGKTGTIWTSANDGSGSGLDADTIDGTAIVGSQIWTSANDGSGSGLDGDLLDGISSGGFLQTSSYQALAPTWSAQHTWTGTNGSGGSSAIYISTATPGIGLRESGAAANNKIWGIDVSSEQLHLRAFNDASSSAGDIMTVDRTANTIDSIALTSTALTWNGSAMVNVGSAPTWTGNHTFTSSGASLTTAGITLSAAIPGLYLRETAASANNGRWREFANGEQLQFQTINDAENATSPWLTVDRTGTTVDSVAFPTEASGGFRVGTVSGGFINSARAYIRASTSATALQVANSPGSSSTSVVYINNEATSGDSKFITFATDSAGLGTERGSIDFNRGGVATRYNTTSDERLKKNIRPAPSARSVIDCIKIESFDWKKTGYHVEHGVVAQHLNKCADYAVSKGDVWQVDKSTLIPAMIKYMQEQDARIARLEADAARRH